MSHGPSAVEAGTPAFERLLQDLGGVPGAPAAAKRVPLALTSSRNVAQTKFSRGPDGSRGFLPSRQHPAAAQAAAAAAAAAPPAEGAPAQRPAPQAARPAPAEGKRGAAVPAPGAAPGARLLKAQVPPALRHLYEEFREEDEESGDVLVFLRLRGADT